MISLNGPRRFRSADATQLPSIGTQLRPSSCEFLTEVRALPIKLTSFRLTSIGTKDCPCDADPCRHVCAAAICLNLSIEKGAPLPRSKTAAAHLEYEFKEQDKRLLLERYIVEGDRRQRLTQKLTTQGEPRAGLEVSPSKIDLAIDIALADRGDDSKRSANSQIFYSSLTQVASRWQAAR